MRISSPNKRTGHGNGGKGIWGHSVALIPLPSSEKGAREMARPRDGQTDRMGDKDGMNTWTCVQKQK